MKPVKTFVCLSFFLFFTESLVAQEVHYKVTAQKSIEVELLSKRSVAVLDKLCNIDSLAMNEGSAKSVNTIIGAQAGLHSPSLITNGNNNFDKGIFIYKVYFSLGPNISIEGLTSSTNAVLSFGAVLKLNLPVWNQKICLVSTIGYKNGAEALNFGGGTRYSFFYYLAGLEYHINN